MFDSFLTEMAGELRLFVIIAICAGLGAGGYFVRTGISRKNHLNEVKQDATRKGQMINTKWYDLERGANQRIWIPIVLWILFYGVIFIAYPNAFPGVLLLLIFPALGFFGILIFPDD